MEFGKQQEGENYIAYSFVGNLDSYGLGEKKAEILDAISKFEKTYLVFNFAELNFLNSESIGFLMQTNEELMAKSKKLILVQAKKNVLDVLEVIGLLETIPYFKNMENFLSSIKNVN